MQHIDGQEISVGIDLDQGGRIASLQWRDLQFAVPFRGTPLSWGWYPMAPWAGRINEGLITGADGTEHTLPTTWAPPHAIHGYAFTSGWEEVGKGRARLELPAPYNGAVVEQTIEQVVVVKGNDPFGRDVEMPVLADESQRPFEQGDGSGKQYLRITSQILVTRLHQFIATAAPIIPGTDPAGLFPDA